jgi:hypothetical protein
MRKYAFSMTREHSRRAWSKLTGLGDPPTWTGSFTFRLRQIAHTRFKDIVVWSGTAVLFIIILYLLLAVVNGTVFHLRYTLGTLCKQSDTVSKITARTTTSFEVINSCHATGIKLEKGKTYRFNVADASLNDGESHATDPDGFSSTRLFPFVPLRRHVTEPWMKLHGKIDAGGFETFPLGKGEIDYTARSNGELFLYVNDAVLGLFPEWDLPYKWELGKNIGKVAVKVSEVHSGG